jgi:hypothetical protein
MKDTLATHQMAWQKSLAYDWIFERDGIEPFTKIDWRVRSGRDLLRGSPRIFSVRMLARSSGAAAGTAAGQGFEHR